MTSQFVIETAIIDPQQLQTYLCLRALVLTEIPFVQTEWVWNKIPDVTATGSFSWR